MELSAVEKPCADMERKPLTGVTSSSSTGKMAVTSKESASPDPLWVPELIDAGGGGDQHSAPCGVEASMEVSCNDCEDGGPVKSLSV